jgi:hypothetical protein
MVYTCIRGLPEPSLETPSLPAGGNAWRQALPRDELPVNSMETALGPFALTQPRSELVAVAAETPLA